MSKENQGQTTSSQLSETTQAVLQLYQSHLAQVTNDVAQEFSTTVIPEFQLSGFPSRIELAMFYMKKPLQQVFRWLYQSKENTNLTYELTENNIYQLAGFVATATNIKVQEALKYLLELHQNQSFRNYIASTTASHPEYHQVSDQHGSVGRRLGWYALVRATKPKLVIETGVDKGLGACVLAEALLKNRAEGFPGQYIGTDINPNAGYLFQAPYDSVGTIMYGDSIESLKTIDQKIDLFINDSDHSAEYEAREYQTIKDKLSDNSYIIGDNSHVTDKLFQFAIETDRKFSFFLEQPKDHWYPGAGIGLAFR